MAFRVEQIVCMWQEAMAMDEHLNHDSKSCVCVNNNIGAACSSEQPPIPTQAQLHLPTLHVHKATVRWVARTEPAGALIMPRMSTLGFILSQRPSEQNPKENKCRKGFPPQNQGPAVMLCWHCLHCRPSA